MLHIFIFESLKSVTSVDELRRYRASLQSSSDETDCLDRERLFLSQETALCHSYWFTCLIYTIVSCIISRYSENTH